MIKTIFEVPDEVIAMKLGKLANQRNKVMARAANRAATTGRTTIARETAKRYIVARRDINSALKVTKATFSSTTAKLTYRGHHRNLYHYGTGRKSAVSPGKVISWEGGVPNVKVYKARVKTDSSFKPLEEKPKAFVQKMTATNGVVGLFRRQSNARNAKLEGVAGPAIPQIIGNKEVMKQFQNDAGETYMKRMDKEIDNLLGGRA